MSQPSPQLVRKRRRRGASTDEPVTGGRPAMIAMVGFWGICLFAVFSAGGPIQLSRGILFILAGGLMLAIPPRTTLPPIFWFLGGCFLILSSLCLLPAEWFTPQLWRLALREEGLDTGPCVTAHPGQSLEQLGALAVTVVTGLYILSQKVSGRAGPVISLLFPAGVAVYAIVSILAIEQEWTLAWDPVPGLGFFPNRNHTATLLAMGTLTSVASLFQSIKSKNGVSAGLAALAVVVCIWALIGYNLSRAGLLLTLIGLLTWVVCLGRDWISRLLLIMLTAVAAVGAGLFWMADTGIKERLQSNAASSPVHGSGVDDISRNLTADGEAHDFRELVYKDTLTMIAREPWVGCGPGMFRFVFPQYRWFSSTSNNSQCVHPESDWLMVASESGVPAMLVLAGGVILVFVMAARGSRKSPSWPSRLGCLVAAAIVPVHGIIDVPGHLAGLALTAVFLLALVMRDFGGRPVSGFASRWIWRVTGAAILVAGTLLVRDECWNNSPAAISAPQKLAYKAWELYALEQEEQGRTAPVDGMVAEPGSSSSHGEDRLEAAIDLVDDALKISPLDPELHYLKGALAVWFLDKEAIADQSFAIQRQLVPSWVQLPLRQSLQWAGIDSGRAAALWAEAMRRALRLESIAPGTFMNRQQVFTGIMDQAAEDANLSTLAAAHIGTNPASMMSWTNRAHLAALNAELPAFLEGSFAPMRGALLDVWLSRDAVAAVKWIAARWNP